MTREKGREHRYFKATGAGQGFCKSTSLPKDEVLRAAAEPRWRPKAALAPLRTTPSQRDYHFPSLMTTAEGEHVLVDSDAAGPTIARVEAMRFALVWATPERGPVERELVRAFVRGYTSAGGELPPQLAYVEEPARGTGCQRAERGSQGIGQSGGAGLGEMQRC